MAYFVKSTRSIGLTQSVLHFNFKSGPKKFSNLHYTGPDGDSLTLA